MNKAKNYEVTLSLNIKQPAPGELWKESDVRNWIRKTLEENPIVRVEWIDVDFNDDTVFD